MSEFLIRISIIILIDQMSIEIGENTFKPTSYANVQNKKRNDNLASGY